jgi:hypothetical protein
MVMDKMVDLTKSELEWGLSLAFFQHFNYLVDLL